MNSIVCDDYDYSPTTEGRLLFLHWSVFSLFQKVSRPQCRTEDDNKQNHPVVPLHNSFSLFIHDSDLIFVLIYLVLVYEDDENLF